MDGQTFDIPAPGEMKDVTEGGKCCLCVRPESVFLTDDANGLPGIITRATYYGDKVEYELKYKEQSVIVEVYSSQLTRRFEVGDAVRMTFVDKNVRVLA